MASPHTSLAASAHEGLGHGRGLGPHRLLGVGRPGRVVDADPRQLDALEHLGRLVLDGLEGGDRAVELHPHLGVLDGQVEGLLHRAQRLGAQRHRARRRPPASRSRCGRRRGPTGTAGVSSSSRRARRRVTSSEGYSSARGASIRNVPIPCWVRAGDQHPVGACARRAPPTWCPAGATGRTCARPGCGSGRPRRRGPPRRWPPCPGWPRWPARPAGRRDPGARAASVASTADEKKGPGSGRRPISSSTTIISSRPMPAPPWASGTSRPDPSQLDHRGPRARRSRPGRRPPSART